MFIRHKLFTLMIVLCSLLGILECKLPDIKADTIQLTGTVRDFKTDHPDFEQTSICGLKTGLVGSTLGSDSKPTFGPNGTDCITSSETFSQWYNDTSGINLSTSYTITLDNGKTESGGVYTYENVEFFPIDNQLFGNEGNSHNFHFTFELHTEFTYTGGETFNFTSDDDLWIFINNTLVVDLGGVHDPASGSVNLDTLGLVKGNTYAFDLFFAERHTGGSVLIFQTGIKLQSTPTPSPTPTPIFSLPPFPSPPPPPTLPPLPTPSLVPSPSATPSLPPFPSPPPRPTLSPLPTPTPTGGNGIVFGLVHDPDDNHLPGVTVTIKGTDYSNSIETDAQGFYVFRNLSAGAYTLMYEKEGYKTETVDITLKENDVRDLGTLTLEVVVKAKISGSVVDIRGNPIESVNLRLKGIKTGYDSTMSSDADGFFEFTDLEADTYILIAKKKGYKRAKQTIKLGDGEEKQIEIKMKKTSKKIINASSVH